MGKRGRVQKKYRPRYSFQLTMQNSTIEKTNSMPDRLDMITPSTTPSFFQKSDSNGNSYDNHNCTPESILVGNKTMGYYDTSPKMNARYHSFKLNLDIPENDEVDDIEDGRKNANRDCDFKTSKDLEKTLSVEKVFDSENEESTRSTLKADYFTKCFSLNVQTNSKLMDVPQKEFTSLSGYFCIPSSTFNIPISIEASSSNHDFASGPIQSNSEINDDGSLNNADHYTQNQLLEINSNLRDDCLLSNKKSNRSSFIYESHITVDNNEKPESTNRKTILNIYEDKSWYSTLGNNNTCINLPVISDIDSKTTGIESQITILNNASDVAFLNSEKTSYYYLRKLKAPFSKIRIFCKKFARKYITWMKQGYESIKNFLSTIITASNSSSLVNSELMQVIAVVKCENERILSVLSEKILSLSQELLEVRLSSEANLLTLKDDISKGQISNIHLAESTSNLVKEFKILQEKVQEIKSSSLFESTAITKNSFSIMPHPPLFTPYATAPSFGLPAPPPPRPPPPPPPLPPPIMLRSKVKSTDSFTPSHGFDSNTPVKNSTPLSSRPAITVEDLLKVTLRKAPQNLKALENRRNTIPGPRGPAISLDMLRNVKLKSARRRSLDQHKSPRNASRLTRNRSQLNVNLSPRSLHAESSLSRSLKLADANRRVLKKI